MHITLKCCIRFREEFLKERIADCSKLMDKANDSATFKFYQTFINSDNDELVEIKKAMEEDDRAEMAKFDKLIAKSEELMELNS